MADQLPKTIKVERFEFGGYVVEVHLLDNGQTVIPQDSMINFEKAIMENKVTDDEARKFSDKISNYKF